MGESEGEREGVALSKASSYVFDEASARREKSEIILKLDWVYSSCLLDVSLSFVHSFFLSPPPPPLHIKGKATKCCLDTPSSKVLFLSPFRLLEKEKIASRLDVRSVLRQYVNKVVFVLIL